MGGSFCYGSGEPCVLAKFTRCLTCSNLPSPHNHPDMFYKFAHLTVCCAFFGLHCFFTVCVCRNTHKSEKTLKKNTYIKTTHICLEFGRINTLFQNNDIRNGFNQSTWSRNFYCSIVVSAKKYNYIVLKIRYTNAKQTERE